MSSVRIPVESGSNGTGSHQEAEDHLALSSTHATDRGGRPDAAQSGAERVPRPALWLGMAGALPFLLLAAATLLAAPEHRPEAARAAAGYGAVILSFLGGIHWGLALRAGRPDWRPLGLGVVPSLVGWAALLLPLQGSSMLLAIAFVAMAVIDHRAARSGAAPAWYPRLRWPLSGAVTASLCLTELALAR